MAAESSKDLSSLKDLLFSTEQQQLSALQNQLAALDQRVGSDDHLTNSVADIVAAALRRAEVKGHRELAASISPLVVASIRREIVESRDIMVEALYPITGRLVTTSVTRAIQKLSADINARFDALLSPQAVWLRAKAALTGRSYGEILLSQSGAFHVQQILLVDAQSGLCLAGWPENASNNVDMISALLTAIMEFSREAFAQSDGELRSLNLGNQLLLLRRSPNYIVAAVGRGQVTPELEQKADEGFLTLLEQLPGTEGTAQGPLLAQLQERLTLAQLLPQKTKRRLSPALVIAAVLALLLAGFAAWSAWRSYQAHQLQTRIHSVTDMPELLGYPVRVSASEAAVQVSGLAPDGAARDLLQQRIAEIFPKAPVLMAVSLVPSLAAVQQLSAQAVDLQRGQDELQALQQKTLSMIGGVDQAGVQRQNSLSQALDQKINATVQGLDSKVQAQVSVADDLLKSQRAALAQLTAQMAAVSGNVQALSGTLQEVKSLAAGPEPQLQQFIVKNAVFFDDGETYHNEEAVKNVLAELAQLLKNAPDVRLRVVGISDERGATSSGNRQVAHNRAVHVINDLVALGVAENRLIVVSRPSPPRISENDGPGSPNRRVAFEAAMNGE